MSTTSIKQSKLKEVRGRRLFRALRRQFKRSDFKFKWSEADTAYWDGETMHIKYTISTPFTPYTEVESDIIRYGLAYHEMGHRIYDDFTVYQQWIKDNSSDDKQDWEDNLKWPNWFVSSAANIAADGRLEAAIIIDYPFTQQYIEFLNNRWAFQITPENERISDLFEDFNEMFSRRSLRLADAPGIKDEVIELIDTHQHLIDGFINTFSTIECLTALGEFIKAVWPTISQWIDLDKPRQTPIIKPSHEVTDWGSDSKINANQRARDKADNKPSDDSNQSSQTGQIKRDIMEMAQQLLEQDDAIAEQENKPVPVSTDVLQTNGKAGSIRLPVKELGVDVIDGEAFEIMEEELDLQIKGLTKAFKALLQPVPDEVNNNSRSGRFRPNLAWKGLKCDNPQMYRKISPGIPSGNVYFSIMGDVSGSTNGWINKSIRETITALCSAAHNAQIPSTAYAFTEGIEITHIYQLKPNPNEFTLRDKAQIGGLRSLSYNRDTASLQYLINNLSSRSESIRVGFIISDGSPNFEDGEGENTIKEMVKGAAANGLHIICIYIGPDERGYDCSKRMYKNIVRSRTSLVKDLKLQLLKLIETNR